MSRAVDTELFSRV